MAEAAETFDAIADLVERGEYLDEIQGEPRREPRPGIPEGMAWAVMYRRGSAELGEALASGDAKPLPSPPYAAVDAAAIDEFESEAGLVLPALLRQLYTEVGNGGFGPGYGLLGMSGGHGLTNGTGPDFWRAGQAGSNPLPAHLYPVCDWGCATFSFIDCSDPDARMWGNAPGADLGPFPQEMTFTEWLALWLDHKLVQPCAVLDDETGEPRGATNDEAAAILGS